MAERCRNGLGQCEHCINPTLWQVIATAPCEWTLEHRNTDNVTIGAYTVQSEIN